MTMKLTKSAERAFGVAARLFCLVALPSPCVAQGTLTDASKAPSIATQAHLATVAEWAAFADTEDFALADRGFVGS